jgi:transcriptional antiterminator RfaH
LQTKVKQEQRAAENLERQDVASFCPMIRVDKISRGRRSEVLDVLFPGYLFVQLGESSVSTTAVRSTRGVSHFVTSAGAPIKVPQGLVEQLRQRVTADADVVMSQLPKSGAKMQVIDGPFKGLNAVFTEPDGNNRAIVMVTLLSQQVKTSMPFASLIEDDNG